MTDTGDQMVDAMRRQFSRSRESMMVDRRGWTDAQWCEDAHRLMNEEDGAITSLVNGHVNALLSERKKLREQRGVLAGAAQIYVDAFRKDELMSLTAKLALQQVEEVLAEFRAEFAPKEER